MKTGTLCARAMFHGVEGPEEAMSYRHKDLHQAVKSKTSGENQKAKVLWALKEAKDRGVDFYDESPSKPGPLGHQF